MPSLIRLADGSVRWDYDLPADEPVEDAPAVKGKGTTAKQKES